MSIIRGDTVSEAVLLLSPTGTSSQTLPSKPVDWIATECHASFEKGHALGEQVGYDKASHELALLFDLLQNVTHKTLELKQKLLDQLKPEVIELVIAVSERIIRKELSQPQTMVRLIQTLLNTALPLLKEERLVVALAPDDFILLEKQFDLMQYDIQEGTDIHFVSDPLLPRGDCRIETKQGLLNYDIQRALADLQEKVLQ